MRHVARQPSREAAFEALALDAVAAEVCGALAVAGVPTAVLKGPVLVKRLYDDDARRSYRDVDLLVPHCDESATYEVLQQLGFVAASGTGSVDPGVADHHQWFRSDAIVEVHVSLIGINAEPADVWPLLAQHMTTQRVGGREVRTLDDVGLAFHIALHAAQHGRSWSKSIEDLDRALAQWPLSAWSRAADLAVELNAATAFAAGLRLHAEGVVLADSLGLTALPDVPTALRAQSAPDLAFGLERLARRRGWLGRASHVVSVLFPSPAFMRWWSPTARAGRLGLAVAYVYRPVWLMLRLPAACLAYLRAARDTSRR